MQDSRKIEGFGSRYTYTTPEDRAEMLSSIGVSEVDELFECIPPEVRLDQALDLPDEHSELEVMTELSGLAARNTTADDEVSFLGAGMYDHYVPAVVDSIASRSEFLTPYTPYQPEIAQGGLQVMFEFQTAISQLTGLPVANASVYDGPSAVAAAAWMARLATGRSKVVVSRGVHPDSRQALTTTGIPAGLSIDEAPLAQGTTQIEAVREAIDDTTAAVIVQQPSFLGGIEDLSLLAEAAHAVGALLVCAADPIALGILRSPGECGVDVCVGEGQPLGGQLSFGGPSFGFFSATEELARVMPGRIAGETVDTNGERGFALVLQTREQHIRRERATSNICTAQAHNALTAMLYMAWLGKQGMVDLGELLVRRTAYVREQLSSVPGLRVLDCGPVVREFAVLLDAPEELVVRASAARGVNPGLPLSRDYPELGSALLVAVTERRSREHLDLLRDVLTDVMGELSTPAIPTLLAA